MSSEITVGASISVYKAAAMSSAQARAASAVSFNMAGSYYSEGVVTVATTPGTAIPLGQVTQPNWTWLKNLDATNFVSIRNGSGGANVAKLRPGQFAVLPFDETGTPWAVADTAAVLLEYAIFSL